jgi:DMSO/TMAO reductase YedYZ molybdopterin-dependent catalytic subunit
MIVSVIVGGAPTPITAVGSRVIDATPGAVKDWAIRTLGENDKPALLAGIYTALAVIAAITGIVAIYHRRAALLAATVLGLIGLTASIADRTSLVSTGAKLAPAVTALLVSVGALYLFTRSLPRAGSDAEGASEADEEPLLAVGAGPSHASAPAVKHHRSEPAFRQEPTRRPKSAVRGTAGSGPDRPDENSAPDGFDRRAFLIAVMASSAVAATGFAVSRSFGDVGARSRESITLPKAADGVSPLQQGMRLDNVTGITPYLTNNRDFYRVDTALTVPQIDANSWRLKIHGLVDEDIELSFAELLAMPLVERRITIACVSNEVGGRLAGNATWLGVRLSDLLSAVAISSGADAVKSTSVDGMTIGTPLEALTDDRDALLALGMNGEPLPLEHGFPVRMVVPGLYGYVSATKWLVDLELTRFDDFSAYWTDRGFDAKAPIKTFSRIDVPKSFASLDAGKNAVAGVAWAQNTGIEKVEVSFDGDSWQEARLADEDSIQTWRQWVYEWDAKPGSYQIQVRATDQNGDTQTSRRVAPRPNGATGWHSVNVSVA